MILIVLVLVVVIATVVVIARKRSTTATPSHSLTGARRLAGSPPGASTPEVAPYVDALLTRWTDAGVLSRQGAEKIRVFEQASIEAAQPTSVKRSNVHAVAEALGYLGGLLGLVGVAVLLADFWDDFAESVRLGIPLGATVVLVIAGFFVPEHQSSAMTRLRAFLWFLATIASGLAGWVFSEVVLDLDEARRQWLVIGVASAVVGFALWAGRNRPLQQFMASASSAIIIGTAIGEFASAGVSGIGIWLAGAAVLVATIRRTGTKAQVAHLAGSLAVVVGAYLTVSEWMGSGLVFVIGSGLLLAAPSSLKIIELPSPTPLITGIVGLVALVQATPMAISHFARSAGLVTGLVVWSIGVAVFCLVTTKMLRLPLVFFIASGGLIIGGAAVAGSQVAGFATVFGLATSIALVVLGSRPGLAVMSVFGLVGVVIFIPWGIAHFFPGENRAPLLIIVSGFVLVGAAVVMSRISGRLRGEVRTRG